VWLKPWNVATLKVTVNGTLRQHGFLFAFHCNFSRFNAIYERDRHRTIARARAMQPRYRLQSRDKNGYSYHHETLRVTGKCSGIMHWIRQVVAASYSVAPVERQKLFWQHCILDWLQQLANIGFGRVCLWSC